MIILEQLKLVLIDISDESGKVSFNIELKIENKDKESNVALKLDDFQNDDICEQRSSIRNNYVKLSVKQFKKLDIKKYPYDSLTINCSLLSKKELKLDQGSLEKDISSAVTTSPKWKLKEDSLKVSLNSTEQLDGSSVLDISFTVARNADFFKQQYLIPIFGICASSLSLISVDTFIVTQRLLIVGLLLVAFLMLNLSYISISPKQVTSFTSLFLMGYCYLLLTALIVMIASADTTAMEIFDTLFHILFVIGWAIIVALFHIKNSSINIQDILNRLKLPVAKTKTGTAAKETPADIETAVPVTRAVEVKASEKSLKKEKGLKEVPDKVDEVASSEETKTPDVEDKTSETSKQDQEENTKQQDYEV